MSGAGFLSVGAVEDDANMARAIGAMLTRVGAPLGKRRVALPASEAQVSPGAKCVVNVNNVSSHSLVPSPHRTLST